MTALLRESCIQHPANLAFLAIRPDYLGICDGDHCMAALLSVFEHWHNIKLEHRKQARTQNRIARMG